MTKKELRNLLVAVVLATVGAVGTAYWTINGQVGDLRERVSHLEGRLRGIKMDLSVTVAKAKALEGSLAKAQAQVVALEEKSLAGDRTIRWVATALDLKALKPTSRDDYAKILEEYYKKNGGRGPIEIPPSLGR